VKPLWFGPEDRPLFGWLHVPDDCQARGGVLLCPTLGVEAVSARYAYRRLAERLAEAGFVSLRFDYDGVGDSVGQQDDPGRVRAWLESISTATDFVRSLGVIRLSVVGLRVGATLAAETFGNGPATIDDLVLWDPCATGRNFIREQAALWSIVLGGRSNDDGSVETPGLVYEKETVADLSGLAIAEGDGPLADGVLLLTRSNRKGDRKMNERLAMDHVDRTAIFGQEELVDVQPDAAITPEATIEVIAEWLDSRAGTNRTTNVDLEASGRSSAVVATTADGASIVERTMSMGPLGLFGIMTLREDRDSGLTPASGHLTDADSLHPGDEAPTVFFFNAGVLDHVGPARLWVLLSRQWAVAGIRSVRFDLTGLGDSPRRADRNRPILFAPDALDDVLDVLREVSPDAPENAVLVGLCSGGYHSIEAAIALKVRGLCTVNPILTIKPPELASDFITELRPGALGARREALGARKMWARRLPAHDLLAPLLERLPDAAWWVINRIVVESPPARLVWKAVEADVDVFVIAGEEEAQHLSRGEVRTMRRLVKNPRFRMRVIPGLEHTLFERRGRELASGMLTDHVLGYYAPNAMEGASPVAT
jgi:alpha-beta hydrolase superfamily lysophospholipase